jgi:lipoyl(octanoyl) transferase
MRSIDTHFLGRVDYAPTYAAMQAFTDSRQHAVEGENGQQSKNYARNQLWICEHPPVFTQGLAGKPDHLLLPGDIPVVQTNRGGQVTYHGPGQVVAYPLLDLKAAGYYVKEYARWLHSTLPATACAARRAFMCAPTTRPATPVC